MMQTNKLELANAPINNVYKLAPKFQYNGVIAKNSQLISQQVQVINNALQSRVCLFFVLITHVCVIYFLIQNSNAPVIKANQSKPILVSLIAPQALEPELAPIIEPPKPVVEPKPKLKKLVEKIVPIEKPTERIVEATTEMPVEENPIVQPQPVAEAETPKAPPKAEPIVEEKIEPPRFGVAYLNNPAPDYPTLSRHMGEQGRVLMKVLVSADGAADEIQIEKSSGSERLDNAAINAVKKWRFIPAKKNNQPLSAYVLVPMKFSLNS